jgi:glycosyltransferase involved in cell wall biosynthesis
VRKYSKAKVVLRAHNVEHLIWERSSRNAKPGEKKWNQQMLAARMKEFEIYHLNSCDALVPITEVDAKRFIELGCKIPMHTCPVGIKPEINTSILNGGNKADIGMAQAVCYIGNMEWIPNLEGVEWFLDQVWPKVISQFPEARLFIAGRNMPSDLLDRSFPNAEMVGEVENARAFIRSKSLMVVPLFSGSGMRVKILEALAEKKPVVTTTMGAEGIAASGDEIMLVADTADAFARQIKKCMKEPPFAHHIGESGFEFVKKHYNNTKLVQDLLKFYASLLQNGKHHS